jgi:L-fucose isomerase-like protein
MDGFAYRMVASPMHDATRLADLRAWIGDALTAIGGREVREDEPAAGIAVTIALTGGTERCMLAACGPAAGPAPEAPAILVAHPGQNSLPAAMETLARIHQLGGRGRIVYLRDASDREGLTAISDAVRDVTAWRALRAARIGLVGEPSDWLVASSPSPDQVREAWGPTVIGVDLAASVLHGALELTGPVIELAEAVAAGATGTTTRPAVVGPDEPKILDAASVYPLLRAIVDREGLDAIAVRCFDLIRELGTSSCLAFARLNDEGVIAGCEGDLVSTVAMLWVRTLLGQLPWMANPARVDPTLNVVRLAHCTVPLTGVSAYRLRTHFESGESVGIEGDLPPGPVTLLRIGGADMRELWVSEGDGLPTEARDDLCRTQLDVRLTGSDVRELLTAPLGNHIVTVPGTHRGRLLGWWETFVAA